VVFKVPASPENFKFICSCHVCYKSCSFNETNCMESFGEADSNYTA
jgi:hypothetical protein